MSIAVGDVIREEFLIAGWVAMWRPLEVVLCDWCLSAHTNICYNGLSIMPVRIEYGETAPAERGARTGRK